eukprot:TRINITY_DN20036_c0_g2_i1.p1 TRINITY_DN20036_c0_g2~~TRINITY_DN20036_c0_g2_i1.p1  ORF type:complete len:850 (-),score=175.02 TRINITY_DN20036_c0_g2_i1:105-2654(-)
MSAFEELGICPEIIQAVQEDDWLLPTPVQQEAVPLILGGGDVLVAAETGSGKTGAFGLPCLQIVHETLRGKCSTRRATASSLKCELNLNDKDMFVLVTEDGLECKSEDDKRWNGIRATVGAMEGCYMFEVEIVSGLVRVGWSAGFASLELGIDEKSFGYGSTGKKSSNRKFEDYGEVFGEGDVIGCLMDRKRQTISYLKNGRMLGVAFKLAQELKRMDLKPHICGRGFEVAIRFQTPFEYPVDGYDAIGKVDPAHTLQGIAQLSGRRSPLCMILEPTRDLAEQTYKCMEKFGKHLENPTVRVTLFVGGIDEKAQFRALEEGVDICVGTLQKLMDFIRRGKLEVAQLKFLVLDEADDLQKKDDRKDIPRLNAQIKRGRHDRVQTLFFSATLHTPEIKQMIEEITSRPIWVDLKGKDMVPETVHHVVLHVDPHNDLPWPDAEIAMRTKTPKEKPLLDGVHERPSMSSVDYWFPEALRLSEKIKRMKPLLVVKLADAFNMSQCLVFCRTNVDCNNLEEFLNRLGGTKAYGGKMETGKENPYSCVVLAGMREQGERRENLASFKEGDIRFLVCTDVAARGIDIAGLPFVIQMTLPDDKENYIHRIGRCGRAEHMGLAIAIVATEKEKVWYHKCPSKGKNCTPWPGNTKLTIPFGPDGKLKARDESSWLVDEGGCTIWYDEPDLLRQVEQRIGQRLPVMDPYTFAIPGLLASPFGDKITTLPTAVAEPKAKLSRRAAKRLKEDASVIVYGAKKNDKAIAMTAKHTSALKPVIDELAQLEIEVQHMFARTQRMFAGAKPTSQVVLPSLLQSRPSRTSMDGPVKHNGGGLHNGDANAKHEGRQPTSWAKGKREARW